MSGSVVGSVRPTQLISTFGIGSAVDLPQISAIVMGLDEWPIGEMLEIREDRLIRVVRQVLGSQVRQLKGAPVKDEDDIRRPFSRNATSSEGVPVAAFPRWLVCTQCRLLAPIRSGLFEFRYDQVKPERSRFIHKNCPRLASPSAIPARFLLACDIGHLVDFPWHQFLHGDSPCTVHGNCAIKDPEWRSRRHFPTVPRM